MWWKNIHSIGRQGLKESVWMVNYQKSLFPFIQWTYVQTSKHKLKGFSLSLLRHSLQKYSAANVDTVNIPYSHRTSGWDCLLLLSSRKREKLAGSEYGPGIWFRSWKKLVLVQHGKRLMSPPHPHPSPAPLRSSKLLKNLLLLCSLMAVKPLIRFVWLSWGLSWMFSFSCQPTLRACDLSKASQSFSKRKWGLSDSRRKPGAYFAPPPPHPHLFFFMHSSLCTSGFAFRQKRIHLSWRVGAKQSGLLSLFFLFFFLKHLGS